MKDTKEILRLVSNGELKKAVQRAKTVFKDDSFALQSFRISNISNIFTSGLITFDRYSSELNKICITVLSQVKESESRIRIKKN